MRFYRRSWLYVRRKWQKSLLLLLVFLVSGSMVLGTTMMLQATERNEAMMKEKAGAKVIVEVKDADHLIERKQADAIAAWPQVASLNRVSRQVASLAKGQALGGQPPNGQQVQLVAYDDMGADGPFSDDTYRLSAGRFIDAATPQGAVVHEQLAQANGWQVGDALPLLDADGETVSVPIVGFFYSGNESQQSDALPAVQRIENQIFIDAATVARLFPAAGFEKILVYSQTPDALEALSQQLEARLAASATVTTTDALYGQMGASLAQLIKMVAMMRGVALITGAGVVVLLLALWLRERQWELAVLMSVGESRWRFFCQVLVEVGLLFIPAVVMNVGVCSLLAGWLQELLSQAAAETVLVTVDAQILGTVALAGAGLCALAVGVAFLPLAFSSPRTLLTRMEE